MRKVFLVILLTGLMVFGSFAQMNDMMFGVKGGLTLGKLSIENDSDINDNWDRKFRMGFAVGGMMVMPLNENMHLQGELLYVMKGEKFEVKDTLGDDFDISADVIEVPILLKYMAMENMAVYGGVSLDYIMSAKDKGDSYENDLIEDEIVKRFGFGLSFGAQYIMDQIIFDARYDIGLSNIFEEDNMYYGFMGKTKLNTIYVTVGYLFE